MSSGLPVVAVAAGGLVDIMKDCEGTTGALLVCIDVCSNVCRRGGDVR